MRAYAFIKEDILTEDIYVDIIKRWRKANPGITSLEVKDALNDLWFGGDRIIKNKPRRYADKYDLSLPVSLANLADGAAIRKELRSSGKKRHTRVTRDLRAISGGQKPGQLDSNVWRRDIEAEIAGTAANEVGVQFDKDGNKVLDYGPGFDPETGYRPVTTRVGDMWDQTDPGDELDASAGDEVRSDLVVPGYEDDPVGDATFDNELTNYSTADPTPTPEPYTGWDDDDAETAGTSTGSSSDGELQRLRDKIAALEKAASVRDAERTSTPQTITGPETDKAHGDVFKPEGPTPEELAAAKAAEEEAARNAEAARKEAARKAQAEAKKAELAARREAMKQAWLKDDLSQITNADDLKKAKRKWSDREGTFSTSGPMRIAGEEPDLFKYMKGERINQDTGKWEQKQKKAPAWKNPNKEEGGGGDDR